MTEKGCFEEKENRLLQKKICSFRFASFSLFQCCCLAFFVPFAAFLRCLLLAGVCVCFCRVFVLFALCMHHLSFISKESLIIAEHTNQPIVNMKRSAVLFSLVIFLPFLYSQEQEAEETCYLTGRYCYTKIFLITSLSHLDVSK